MPSWLSDCGRLPFDDTMACKRRLRDDGAMALVAQWVRLGSGCGGGAFGWRACGWVGKGFEVGAERLRSSALTMVKSCCGGGAAAAPARVRPAVRA